MGDLVKPIILGALMSAVLLSTYADVAQASGEADKRSQAEHLVSEFWETVWTPNPDLTVAAGTRATFGRGLVIR